MTMSPFYRVFYIGAKKYFDAWVICFRWYEYWGCSKVWLLSRQKKATYSLRHRHLLTVDTEGKQEEQDLALDLNLPFNIQVYFWYAGKFYKYIIPSDEQDKNPCKHLKRRGKIVDMIFPFCIANICTNPSHKCFMKSNFV